MAIESAKKTCWPHVRISARLILSAFVALLLFVFLNVLTSTSKLAVVVNMSIKMKSDMLKALNDALGSLPPDTASISGNVAIKRFTNKNDMERDYTNWKETHNERERLETGSITSYGIQDLFMTNSVSNISQTPFSTDKEYRNTVVPFDVLGNAFNSSEKTRKSTCFGCFKHNFKYVIENDNICQETSYTEKVSLIIIILTTHRNVNSRNALRRTWLTYTKENTGKVRYAFLLGESNFPAHRQSVIEENNLFHDIIKEDFVDSYKNLTYKTIMGLKWVSQKCSNAKYLLKTDDDMWINIPTLMASLENPVVEERLKTSIAGMCTQKALPIRNRQSKWYASYLSFPEKMYPGFCSGTGYVTSVKVANQIYEISPNVPFFHLEDVYVALCVRKLGLRLAPMPGFNSGRPKMDPCVYKGPKLITAHQLSPTMMQIMWNRSCNKTITADLLKRIS